MSNPATFSVEAPIQTELPDWYRRLQLLTSVVVIVGLALLLIACGGDDESDSSATSSSTSSSTTATAVESTPADFEAMGAVRTAQVALETLATDNAGKYSGITVEKMVRIEPTLAEADLTVESDATSYTVTVATEDNSYSVTRARDASLAYPCGSPGVGECGPDGSWNPHP